MNTPLLDAHGNPICSQDREAAVSQDVAAEGALASCGRRKFIGVASATAASLLAGVGNADAFLFGSSSKPVAGIPASWVRLKGKDVYRYANFIEGLRLRYITPRMVLSPHFKTRGRVVNSLPPKNRWRKIGPTLKIIDQMAHEMGAPVRQIISAYRSPRYNRAVRGKSKSLHLNNQAIDVMFRGVSPCHVARVARYMRDEQGEFEGGVGRYSSFVHVDTRGYNADW